MGTPASINADIGANMLQLGRRLPRSEIAKRVAHIDNYHMRHLCYKWFYDAEPSFTNWGPIETMTSCGSYKYFKINTMSTVTNAHHTLFTCATLSLISCDISAARNELYIWHHTYAHI